MTLSPLTIYAFSNGQDAFLVLGQKDFTSNITATTQKGMNNPAGVAVRVGGIVWVADTNNNRVLKFTTPFTNDEAASVVLGQPIFTSNTAATTQTGMHDPTGVAVDSSGNIWVADSGNNRVLEFTTPFTNGEAATIVLGQPGFTSNTAHTTKAGMFGPTAVAVGPLGNVWVVDQRNSRVLQFIKGGGFSDGQAASIVLGQASFTSKITATTQTGMNNPSGVAVDSSGNVWVADQGNNRVIEFASPYTKGEAASVVLGQSIFTSSTSATSQIGMFSPTGVAVDSSGNVWVADSDNNRILDFQKGLGFTDGQAAISVLGQSTFMSRTPATNKTGLTFPTDVSVGPFGTVWVADQFNSRILQFLSSTTTSVKCVPSPVPVSKPTTCTSTVSDTGGVTTTPTGIVTFTSSLISSASCTLSGSGSSASCSLTFAPASTGTFKIVAKYSGDNVLLGSGGSFKLKVT